MAEVWLARHRTQKVDVAIKIMMGRQVKERRFLQQFAEEVRAVAALDHPGIVMVLDHGEVDEAAAEASRQLTAGCPWLAMELASGGSLESEASRLDWDGIRTSLLATLDALSFFH